MASGSVEPARLMASASTSTPCIERALLPFRSLPVLALYMSLIFFNPALAAATSLPHTSRVSTPCTCGPTSCTKRESMKPASLASRTGGAYLLSRIVRTNSMASDV
ncbi:hypothetical protein G6F60_015211 [Rhizopus arrhizus]|nr:hypothetical protein G6F65_021434 [Rhizopus arrhizus]KAG1380179.1 hypothetical protein G6F60_015211 [Rhizopus arrhizus]